MAEAGVVERVRAAVRRPPLRDLIRSVLEEHGAYTPGLCRALGMAITKDEICMTELWARIDHESRAVKQENALLQRTLDGLAEELIDCIDGEAGG